MNNLNFKYFAAKNFVCFGPEGIEIDLTKLGNIILVRGENLDVIDEEEKEGDERVASNGIGKSSIPEILIYTLFGKTIKSHKKIKHENVINNQVKKDLRTEVRWDKFRVVRTRNPTGLRMWQSEEGIWNKDTEITLGGMSDTQDLIIEKLGINYDTCLNLLVFADQSHFLECDAAQKRTVVEDLMSLQIFRAYAEQAKEEKNTLKGQLKLAIAAYETSLLELKSAKERINKINQEEKNWYAARKQELLGLQTQKANKKDTLKASDIGPALTAYESAQIKIQELGTNIQEIETQQSKIRETLQQYEEKVEVRKKEKSDLDLRIQGLESRLQKSKLEIIDKKGILKVKNKKGQRCGECYGIVAEENYSLFVENAQKSIDENEKVIKEASELKKELFSQSEDIRIKLTKANHAILTGQTQEREFGRKIDSSRKEIQKLAAIQKPTANDQEKVLLVEIAELDRQINDKEEQINGPTPYVGLLASAEKDVEVKERESQNKKAEVDVIDSDLPYYEWWTEGFSPKGIPKFAINDIIPTLNNQVAHWLEFLIDGKIKLTFNNELEEVIERNPSDGDPFVYYAMSGGERRRLNLAVSQAFAYIMTHSSKASPSVVFLDEVTTNIDQMGVVGVYNMILELAKEKQVFVTTHDQGLLDLMQGCETLYLRKKGGFTKLVNNI